jgi:transitional endoplasmic reticulum ATPase
VSKWYGQSEELLRKIFEHAERQTSAIIFFDEIDSIAAQRDEDAHEASRRLVAQLLTLMDGFKPSSNVVVIATTNRPQDIDNALLRPGRFDWEIHFPLPSRYDRESILTASARQLRTIDELPHALIAEKTDGWSGAELTAIWTDAALLAAANGRDAIMAEDYIGGFERVSARRSASTTKTGGKS